MKKVLVLLMMFLIATVIVACDPPDGLIDPDDRVEKFEPGATEINMWVNDFEEWENKLNVSNRFDFNDNLEDGIQLKQTFVPVDDFDDRIRAARETNNEPDIYMVSYGNLYRDIKGGWLADCSSLFDQSVWDDLFESARVGITYGGKKYGMPILTEPSTMLFYRKDLLNLYANTTTVPTDWWGFIDLLKTVKAGITAVKQKGVYPFDVPKGVGGGWASWGMQHAASGGLALLDDWSAPRVNCEGYANLGLLWNELFMNGLVPLSSGGYTEIITDMCSGKLVFTTAGSWSISTIMNKFPMQAKDIGVMPMPTFDGNPDKVTATNGGWVWVISQNSKNKAKAAEVIKFLCGGTNTEPLLKYFRGAKYSKSSARISVQDILLGEVSKQTQIPSEWIDTLHYVSQRGIMEPIYPWDISVYVYAFMETCATFSNANATLLNTKIQEELDALYTLLETYIYNNGLSGNNPRL